jgi:predicted nucleic acid-binding protein
LLRERDILKKLKVYLDTSVLSFVYADDAPEKQALTIEFFEKSLEDYDVFISEIVLAEIENATDPLLRRKIRKVADKYSIKVLEIFEEARDEIFVLAGKYVKEGVIPEKKFDDAVHIAICVYFDFDILLSWNFKHLANINKQIKVNAINKKLGYQKELYLLNPMEVINEKEE